MRPSVLLCSRRGFLCVFPRLERIHFWIIQAVVGGRNMLATSAQKRRSLQRNGRRWPKGEGRGFECPHCRSTSLLGSHLLAAALFLRNDVHFYYINEGSKKEKKRVITCKAEPLGNLRLLGLERCGINKVYLKNSASEIRDEGGNTRRK